MSRSLCISVCDRHVWSTLKLINHCWTLSDRKHREVYEVWKQHIFNGRNARPELAGKQQFHNRVYLTWTSNTSNTNTQTEVYEGIVIVVVSSLDVLIKITPLQTKHVCPAHPYEQHNTYILRRPNFMVSPCRSPRSSLSYLLIAVSLGGSSHRAFSWKELPIATGIPQLIFTSG